jgi:hypothetical protein
MPTHSLFIFLVFAPVSGAKTCQDAWGSWLSAPRKHLTSAFDALAWVSSGETAEANLISDRLFISLRDKTNQGLWHQIFDLSHSILPQQKFSNDDCSCLCLDSDLCNKENACNASIPYMLPKLTTGDKSLSWFHLLVDFNAVFPSRNIKC